MRSMQRTLGVYAVLTATLLSRLFALDAADTASPQSLRLSAPLDYQVQQRSSPTEGNILIAGSLSSASEEPSTLEGRILGTDLPTEWQKLAILPSGTTEFRTEITGAAGGWYRLEIRVTHKNLVAAETAIEHVGIGEVFVIAGQSNAANHGEEKQQTKTGRVAALYKGKWQLANDPQPGASGRAGSFMPPFGDAIAERFTIPVGIVATAVGATSVREWLPRGTRFPNPPTLTGHVTQLANGEWESNGTLFDPFVGRMRELGPKGFRAVLWHQGESDANQADATRTLSGPLYRQFLEKLIKDSSGKLAWEPPWFVALASYHTPNDPGSPEIREAQKAMWKSGLAFEGPDSDAMTGDLRDGGGQGVHFSGEGLREHGIRWAEKVSPWLEGRLSHASPSSRPNNPKTSAAPSRLTLPHTEGLTVADRPAFIFLPPESKRSNPQPWIFYAPTLPPYPDEAERWMHEQFVNAGIAVGGVDVGEAYGNPASLAVFDALYRELTERRGFAAKPCLMGRSRGGLWVSSWAIAHPDRVAGLVGIYPVFDFRTYPGLTKTAAAYGLTPEELEAQAGTFNPIARIETLARARVPAILIHGDSDTVVPIQENSAEFVRRYKQAGGESFVRLIVIEGQGHNLFEGFFHSQELVDFAIARARSGAD